VIFWLSTHSLGFSIIIGIVHEYESDLKLPVAAHYRLSGRVMAAL
jgi:hypothetical protein